MELFKKILTELGLLSLWQSSRDVELLCAQRFVRLFAYGGSTLILASYLSALGISDARIGLFMTLTLVGDVVISFFLTLFADTMGRKAVLLLGSILMAGSGVIFALFGNFWVLLAAAVLGVISPSGNEIGPFRAVEESTLAHLTPHELLSDIFAWYSLIGTAGTALGMMACGWAINLLQVIRGWQFLGACQAIFFAYAAIGVVKFILSLALSSNVEAEEKQDPTQQQGDNTETRPLLDSLAQPKTKPLFSLLKDENLVSLVTRLSILFALDSFASGLASLYVGIRSKWIYILITMPIAYEYCVDYCRSWMTYFFKRKFALPEAKLGSIFFTTSIIAAASMLVASSIAKRFGNIKTMVFTHLPSAICLALIPVPNILPLALTFLILRACSQNMDVAPRSAFLAAALPSDKRTAIMGAINVVKTGSQSLGPLLTGVLANHGFFGLSFTIAGSLKAIYDIGMLLSFAKREPARRRNVTPENGSP
ncbi:major facilitator superfamily domain-containing protein [Aspergillus avenaceus]|uniref:Major facilitator superfamily domain-containing protein n=1 Tax=Aspergillus avenaceus TaxID=36643 RepID=A0A5N6TQG9_ASPAV|nr:major facilitator superfamily domain-containing protein [Aspergillus avenaceus]